MAHIHVDRDILILAFLLIAGIAAGYSILFGSGIPQDVSEPEMRTASILIQEADGRADSRFYSEVVHGDYRIRPYSWSRGALNEEPDSVPLKDKDAYNSLIRFDGNYSDSLRVFSFKTYQVEDSSEPMMLFGSAISIGPDPLLDAFLASGDSFDIGYDPHPQRFQLMEGCTILGALYSETSSGMPLKIYDFRCTIIYGV